MASTTGASHARPAVWMIQPGGPGLAIHGTAPDLRLHFATSTNWSGYAKTGGTFKSVSASWTEPSVSCSGSGTSDAAFWVGLDGDGSSTVEQLGSESGCQNGQAFYDDWREIYPAPSQTISNPVRPGDHFTASVTTSGGGSYTLAIKDTTTGFSKTFHKSANGQNASAEVIVEAPSDGSGVLPLADFHTVNFSSATIDGSAINGATKITMVDSSGQDKDSVSSVGSGGSFSATWLRAN
jgi:hypothetical protein